MPKVLKKENQYNAHNALKYVSLFLRIKKWYFVEKLNKKTWKGAFTLPCSILQGNMSSALNDFSKLFAEHINVLNKF